MTTDTVGSLYEDARKNNPRALPPGTYRWEVIGGKIGQKRNRVLLTAKVLGGELNGQKFFLPGQSLTESSASIFFQTFAGFGLGESFYAPLGTDVELICQETAKACKGAICEGGLVEREYNGKLQNDYDGIGNVKYIGRRDSGGQIQEAGVANPTPQPQQAAPAPSPAPAPQPAQAAPAPQPAPAQTAQAPPQPAETLAEPEATPAAPPAVSPAPQSAQNGAPAPAAEPVATDVDVPF